VQSIDNRLDPDPQWPDAYTAKPARHSPGICVSAPAELVVTTVASRQSDTYVTCEKCDRLFKAGRFKDGSIPTECPTCRVGVDPEGQSISIDTESRF
jgi:hypothetical protein